MLGKPPKNFWGVGLLLLKFGKQISRSFLFCSKTFWTGQIHEEKWAKIDNHGKNLHDGFKMTSLGNCYRTL